MLYSDGIHLITDQGVENLHNEVWKETGIKRCWFHNGGGGRFPHYDIPKLMRKTFFERFPQVKKVDSREIVRILKGESK